MERGLVEGSPISVFIIGLVVSYFLQVLREKPGYRENIAVLEGDALHDTLALQERGWIDDWAIFSNSVDGMLILLNLWEKTLHEFWWNLHHEKTELLAVTGAQFPLVLQASCIKYTDSITWLGCSISASGSAQSHIRLRTTKAISAWQILNKHFDFRKLSFVVKPNCTKALSSQYCYMDAQLSVCRKKIGIVL